MGNIFLSILLILKVKEESGSKKKKALILFEDITLVFDDLDDGFYGAVTTLVQQTNCVDDLGPRIQNIWSSRTTLRS